MPPAGSAANDTPFDVDPATVGRTDGERSALGRAIQGARTDVGRVKYLQRYQDTRRKDTFTGQFAASFDMGQMGQDEAMAWNDYLNDPTQEKRPTPKRSARPALITPGATRPRWTQTLPCPGSASP